MNYEYEISKKNSIIDYQKTFSSIAPFNIIRTIINMASEKLKLIQFDIKTYQYRKLTRGNVQKITKRVQQTNKACRLKNDLYN